jgi:glycosyltransferase involved in cell wall biosynthesis
MVKTAILIHTPDQEDHLSTDFLKTLHALINQTEKNFKVFFIGKLHPTSSQMLRDNDIEFKSISNHDFSYAELLNRIIKEFDGESIMYVDNRQNPVILKNACLETFLIAVERTPGTGFFYADYELNTGMEIREVKLLFHHIGRVRDNQDYGSVWFFNKRAVLDSGGFDESLQFHQWYDMRLKISEQHELIRIGNKYGGSLYTVNASGSKVNVFDYLLSGKDVQLEAEKVLTGHLKRIGAYLPPDYFFEMDYEQDRQAELDASVIIPVGHRPEFIGTAIESVQAQTNKNIEALIIVNGGDSDPTADVVREYMKGGDRFDPEKPTVRLVVIDINNIGLCLNIGARMAKGKYYVQLDSDDRLKPGAVEKILEVFAADEMTGMVIGSYEVWEKREDGELYRMEEIPVVTHDEWTDENGRNNLLRINGAGAPRSIPISLIRAMGYFSINDDAFARNYGEDYEMVNKIAECFKIGRIYDPIYEVVRHSGGTDHSISQEVIDRNDEAKDDMRKAAIYRRMGMFVM